MLINAGAKLDVGDDVGETPLYRAFKSGNTQAARRLLERGANPKLGRDFSEVMFKKTGAKTIEDFLTSHEPPLLLPNAKNISD